MAVVFSSVDLEKFYDGRSNSPTVLHVEDGSAELLLVDEGSLDDGWAWTRAVDDAGSIGDQINELEWDTTKGVGPAPWHRATSGGYSYFGIAYRYSSPRGKIKTIKVSAGGVFDSVVATLTYESTNTPDFPAVVPISGDIYVVLYSTLPFDDHLWIRSFGMSNVGILTGVLSSLEIATDVESGNKHIAGLYYAGHVFVFYQDDTNAGVVKAIPVDAAGNISAVASTDTFDAVEGDAPAVQNISGNVFAIAYEKGGGIYLKTFSISGTVITWLDDLVIGTGTIAKQILPFHIPGFYLITYGSLNLGSVSVVSIADDGTIGVVEATSNSSYTCNPSVVRVGSTNIYVIAGRRLAAYWDGYLRTTEIYGTPDTPTNSLPLDGATGQSLTPTLESSAYAPSVFGGSHHASQWQITDTPGDYSAPIYDSGEDAVNLESIIVPGATLAYNTTYYWHVRHEESDGGWSAYSVETHFAPVAAPTVTTAAASGEAAASATLNGTLSQDGGEDCDCGFEWGLDTGYGTTTATQTKGTGETFSQLIAGLQPNTTYHFRAFATNSAGTSRGADRSFTTALVITRAYALARQEL